MNDIMTSSLREILRISIQEEEDILIARRKVRKESKSLGFGKVDQTRITTAVSELTRNILQHANQGELVAYADEDGMEIVCQDKGPGMPDVKRALEEGYSTTGTLGMGLLGAKRLMDRFEIESDNSGTKVKVYKKIR